MGGKYHSSSGICHRNNFDSLFVMKYFLFLDDDPGRIPCKLTWIQLPLVNWTIVRSYKQFVDTITDRGVPEIVSFDHDLGESAYKEFVKCHAEHRNIDYDRIKDKTGMDCARWLIEYCISNSLTFPQYFVHSMNYIGRENIISLIESYKKSISI